ncbi:uncharacterized protein PV06_08961 [Exophiala oligosperma]|uniref:FAD dependent oxidoreductase domain-containing protein n=1 Tax=Exophiala oligosperma TaxID=215243 RepID=A0A0D2D9N3_9EURO|nr:uncharacterized protein PV06_08961 [Exophiala oligosperma]KIW39160.1 hypothetical protein PV06_08961 [Exophiala oligosperma]
MAPSQFPVKDPAPSVWTASPHPLDDYQSTIELPGQCDVLIVGSGFAGVSTAYHILKDDPDPWSIVLLEARAHCSGATGRNGGHIKPDTYYSAPKYERLYGTRQAAELQLFESSQVWAVKELVDREGLECDFHLTRALDVYLDPDHAAQTYEAYQRMLNDGYFDLRDVSYTGKSDAERISGVKGAQCCFSFTAAHLTPKLLVLGLLERLINQGLQAYAHTPVVKVSPSRDSADFWTVSTTRGDIKARKVIFATNGYTASLLPQYHRKIVPVRGVCSHITTPNGNYSPHLPNTYSLRFGGANYDYLIPRADGSIVVGGARQTFLHHQDRWFNSVSDNERMVPDSERYFDGYMQRHFRGWEASGASTERVWTGVMGYTSDFMPHVGEVPTKPGQYIIAGFSGRGMPYIFLASEGLARMVRHETRYEETKLPSVLKSTRERLSSSESPLEKEFGTVWKDRAQTIPPRL